MDINDNDKDISNGKQDTSINSKKNVGVFNNKCLIVIFTALLFLISNVLFYIFGLNFSSGSYLSSGGLKALSGDISDYRKLMLVKNIISRTYNPYSGAVASDMMDSAIKGMVDSLGDPYTVYMDQNEFYDFNLRSKGNYVGIGIQVAPKEGKIFIISVFKNSPAEKSGIRAGDYIINVSNENVYEDSIDRAISLIKGEEGSSVNLTVEREGKHIQFNVNREKIDVMPVEYEKITEDILYIKINSFDENSSKGVNEALISSNYRGIILDLRGNPGGLLNECVDIASQFIPEGKVIVSMDDKYGNREFINAKKGIAEDKEIVVLGDSGSASASEVLIGALKDHNRAIFVGETTFGKGLVQRVFELGDGSGVKVTVSKYYTPSEEYINKVGIHPNVEVIYSQDEILRHKQMSNGDYVKMRKLDPQYIKALEILKENISS